ncbi:meiotic nuclear division protein 1 isoform X1 [Apis mellifera caucasica]|uniref:Meiotic nuclear division protein 1 homolog n=1 Tax=Apis mellifera TaxID=7460 RepID=A0A7M7H4C0_APIME|nr:meiotic nuclear division protein 1 homolog isoform X1 [Apis mellifera]KAG6801657.1 meiotic nuclear division protein 1 isoform X1 [Apis mellifera caucasica]KAG9430285.1 meiotic nuclear division protein 1 isoform X1 [Apis mellifera carnica]|eukprot:XP_006569200.1 meiotic nuclear division protein 1 homolog isoform X1 [Apis mellifera]
MSKRKGLTLDEKRIRMLHLFYEKKEFFTLKELEKIAPKEKGIIAQSVKDVLQTLVDDGLVRSEKIGTSVYFWTFPGENITAIEQRISEASKKIVEAEFKLQKLKEACEKEKIGKEDTEERQILLHELEELKAKEDQLKKQISKFSDADPEVIAKLLEKAKVEYREATNKWTDNIFAIQSWCKNKFDISEGYLNKQFNIPDDLDYKE